MKINTTYFKLKERHIYGSSRVGVRNSELDVLPLVTQNYAMHSVSYAIGSRTYELSNHLGNVLSVISDKLVPGGGKVIQSNDFSTSFSPYVSGGGSTLSISGGRLSVANASLYSNANIASLATVAGKTYRVTFTADLNGAGQITAHAYDPALATFLSVSPCNSNGTYYLDFLAISSTTRITFESSVTGPRTFYLDNVSIKELNAISSNNFSSTYTPFSPSGSASLSVSGNRLQVSNAGFSHNAHTSTINTVEGKAYRVSFQVDLASSGAISVYAADNTSTGYLNYSTCTVNGSYYLDFTANSASTMIAFESNVVGPRTFYIDNFVLHELPSSSIGTYSNGFGSSVSPFSATGSATAAISGGRMRVQNMGLWENVNASVSTVAGHVYKLWFNIDLASSGNANAFVRDVATSTNLNVTLISVNTGNGIQSIQFTATGVNTLIAFENLVAGPRTLYLDNIWMQDLNAAENAENILLADIRVAQDYSPFGVTLDGRNFVVDEGYRYGYQGSEMDNEVKGEGNSYTTYFRQLDPRLGRWLSIDPKANSFSSISPYVSMGNNPIAFNDIRGDSIPTTFYDEAGNTLDAVPQRIQDMFNDEYGISVGYNKKTGMMYKTGDVNPCGTVSSDAKSEWENLLGTKNTDQKLVFGYNLAIVSGSDLENPYAVAFGVQIPDLNTAFIDLGDVDKEGNMLGMSIENHPVNYSGEDIKRPMNLARTVEHEYLGHGIKKLSDQPTHWSDYTGPTVDLTNSYNIQMGIMEQIYYKTLGNSFGLGDAQKWNSDHSRKIGDSKIKTTYSFDISGVQKMVNILFFP